MRAAGVHSWALAEPFTASHGAFLAGASILHYHFATPVAFRKYLAIAADAPPLDERSFAPSPAEVAALAELRALLAELRPSVLIDTDLGDRCANWAVRSRAEPTSRLPWP